MTEKSTYEKHIEHIFNVYCMIVITVQTAPPAEVKIAFQGDLFALQLLRDLRAPKRI